MKREEAHASFLRLGGTDAASIVWTGVFFSPNHRKPDDPAFQVVLFQPILPDGKVLVD